jgi:hypothetical protein
MKMRVDRNSINRVLRSINDVLRNNNKISKRGMCAMGMAMCVSVRDIDETNRRKAEPYTRYYT